jgi:glycosyltransferase involved in cell wall biosynthesis
MKTSIIICFYEKIDYLKCCLDALTFCSQDFDEVVIADDGSSDDIVEQIGNLTPAYGFPIIHAWHFRQEARRAATRNNGIKNARGDYLIFLDRDCLMLPGAVRAHLNAAKRGRFLAGRFKYLNEEQGKVVLGSSMSAAILENLYRSMPEDPIQKEHRRFVKYGILRRLRLVSGEQQNFGGHFSISKADLEYVNGFDESYIGWGGEDLDLSRRLVKAGFRGHSVIRSARCLHIWHPHELGNKHWKEGPNIEYFQRKNVSFFCENGLRKK